MYHNRSYVERLTGIGSSSSIRISNGGYFPCHVLPQCVRGHHSATEQLEYIGNQKCPSSVCYSSKQPLLGNDSSNCNTVMDTLLQLLYTGLVTDTPQCVGSLFCLFLER